MGKIALLLLLVVTLAVCVFAYPSVEDDTPVADVVPAIRAVRAAAADPDPRGHRYRNDNHGYYHQYNYRNNHHYPRYNRGGYYRGGWHGGH